MKSVEEYLYYNENQDYANLKFNSCTYYRNKKMLLVRYFYAEEIEAQLPILKKRLETLFIQKVGLPIKYEFVYKKVFSDRLTIRLEILSFLQKKFAKISDQTAEENVQINLDHDTWKVELTLPKILINFLEHSRQWQKFKQTLQDKNFYEFEFNFIPSD